MDTITTFVIGFFILIFIANLIWPGHKRLTKEDKELYDAKIPTTEKWAKILRMNDTIRTGPTICFLKLSDGREFVRESTVFGFNLSRIQEGTQDKRPYATLNSSELKIGDTIYQFNVDKAKGSLNYGDSLYTISEAKDSLEKDVKRNNEDFARILHVTDSYTEVLFKDTTLSPEELFSIPAIILYVGISNF